jgi:hypothetical protein
MAGRSSKTVEAKAVLATEERVTNPERREATFEVFRRWGYLQTTLDPLGQYLPKEPFPVALPEGEEDAAAEARGYYCGTIGVEFMHIANAEKREWLQEQMEREAPEVNQERVLTPGNETFFVRRADGSDSVPGPGARGKLGAWGDDGSAGDEPSRSLERDDEYDWASCRRYLYQV